MGEWLGRGEGTRRGYDKIKYDCSAGNIPYTLRHMDRYMCLETHDPMVKNKMMTWLNVVVEKSELMILSGFHLGYIEYRYQIINQWREPVLPVQKQSIVICVLERWMLDSRCSSYELPLFFRILHIHYWNRRLCRASYSLPSVFYRTLGKPSLCRVPN